MKKLTILLSIIPLTISASLSAHDMMSIDSASASSSATCARIINRNGIQSPLMSPPPPNSPSPVDQWNMRQYVKREFETYYLTEHNRFVYDILPDLEVRFNTDPHVVTLNHKEARDKWIKVYTHAHERFQEKMEGHRLTLIRRYYINSPQM